MRCLYGGLSAWVLALVKRLLCAGWHGNGREISSANKEAINDGVTVWACAASSICAFFISSTHSSSFSPHCNFWIDQRPPLHRTVQSAQCDSQEMSSREQWGSQGEVFSSVIFIFLPPRSTSPAYWSARPVGGLNKRSVGSWWKTDCTKHTRTTMLTKGVI